LSVAARVADGAGVFVGAGARLIGVLTSHNRVAGVGCAYVVVVAVKYAIATADSAGALVVCGADVAVVASLCIGYVETALHGGARIICTWIGVIAVHSGTAACACIAFVTGGTGVAVVTGSHVGHELALIAGFVAEVVGAEVAVIASQGNGGACAARAYVVHGAEISIVARQSVVVVDAAGEWLACVVRARIVVVTVDSLARSADTSAAHVVLCARI